VLHRSTPRQGGQTGRGRGFCHRVVSLPPERERRTVPRTSTRGLGRRTPRAASPHSIPRSAAEVWERRRARGHPPGPCRSRVGS
jgi:hypothetical protein